MKNASRSDNDTAGSCEQETADDSDEFSVELGMDYPRIEYSQEVYERVCGRTPVGKAKKNTRNKKVEEWLSEQQSSQTASSLDESNEDRDVSSRGRKRKKKELSDDDHINSQKSSEKKETKERMSGKPPRTLDAKTKERVEESTEESDEESVETTDEDEKMEKGSEEDWTPGRNRMKTRSSKMKRTGEKRGRKKRGQKCQSPPKKAKRRRVVKKARIVSSSEEDEDEEEEESSQKSTPPREVKVKREESIRSRKLRGSTNGKTTDSSQEVPQDPVQLRDRSEKKSTVRHRSKSPAEAKESVGRKSQSAPRAISTPTVKPSEGSTLPSCMLHLFEENSPSASASPSPSLNTFKVPKKKENGREEKRNTGEARSLSFNDQISTQSKGTEKQSGDQERSGWDPRNIAFRPKPRVFRKPSERQPEMEKKRPIDFHRQNDGKSQLPSHRLDSPHTQSPLEQSQSGMESPSSSSSWPRSSFLTPSNTPIEKKPLERYNNAFKQIKNPMESRPNFFPSIQALSSGIRQPTVHFNQRNPNDSTVSDTTVTPRRSILKPSVVQPGILDTMDSFDNSSDLEWNTKSTVARGIDGYGRNDDRRQSTPSSGWMSLEGKSSPISPLATLHPSTHTRPLSSIGGTPVTPTIIHSPSPSLLSSGSIHPSLVRQFIKEEILSPTPRIIPVEAANTVRYRLIPVDGLPPLIQRGNADSSVQAEPIKKCRAVLAAGPFPDTADHEDFIKMMRDKGIEMEWTRCPDTTDTEEMKERVIAALICYEEKDAKSLQSDGSIKVGTNYISIGKPMEALVTVMGLNATTQFDEKETKKELTEALETHIGRLVELVILFTSDVLIEAKARFFYSVHATRAVNSAAISLREGRHIVISACPPDRSTTWICPVESTPPPPTRPPPEKKVVVVPLAVPTVPPPQSTTVPPCPSTVPQPVPPPSLHSISTGATMGSRSSTLSSSSSSSTVSLSQSHTSSSSSSSHEYSPTPSLPLPPPSSSSSHSSKFSPFPPPTALPPPGLIDPLALRLLTRLDHQNTLQMEQTMSIPPIPLPPSVDIPLPPTPIPPPSFVPYLPYPHLPQIKRRFFLPTPTTPPTPSANLMQPVQQMQQMQQLKIVDPATFLKPFEALLPKKKMEIEEKLAKAKAEREEKACEKKKEDDMKEKENEEDEILLFARCLPLGIQSTFSRQDWDAVREYFSDEDCSSRVYGGVVSLRFTGGSAKEKAQILLVESPHDIKGRTFEIGVTYPVLFEASRAVAKTRLYEEMMERFGCVVEVEKKCDPSTDKPVYKIYFDQVEKARTAAAQGITVGDSELKLMGKSP